MGEEQPGLFDKQEAEFRKHQAMDQVESTATAQAWKARALPVLHFIALSIGEFTTDRLEYQLAQSGVGLPPEKRAIGPLMRCGATNGWIVKTDRVVESVMPSNHRRPKAIWRSLIRTKGYR